MILDAVADFFRHARLTGERLAASDHKVNKVHGFSTDQSVGFAFRSVLSCRTREVNGTKNHWKQWIAWWAL